MAQELQRQELQNLPFGMLIGNAGGQTPFGLYPVTFPFFDLHL